MPIPPTYDALLKKLAERTRSGLVNWQETADRDVFIVFLTDYSLSIREWSSPTWEEEGGIAIDIRNEKGKKVDSFDMHYDDPDYKLLYGMFNDARRKARNVDEVIGNMLRELEKEGVVGKESPPEDDGLPTL